MSMNLIHGGKAFKFGGAKTWAEVAANTSAEQTVAAPGARIGDIVLVVKPTHQAGLSNNAVARVAAADQLTIKFENPTASGITPTAKEEWTALSWRPETPLTTDASN